MNREDLKEKTLAAIRRTGGEFFEEGGASAEDSALAEKRSLAFYNLATHSVPRCQDEELYVMLLCYFSLAFLEASFKDGGVFLNPSNFAPLKSLAAGSLKMDFQERREAELFSHSAYGKMYLGLLSTAEGKMLPFSF